MLTTGIPETAVLAYIYIYINNAVVGRINMSKQYLFVCTAIACSLLPSGKLIWLLKMAHSLLIETGTLWLFSIAMENDP